MPKEFTIIGPLRYSDGKRFLISDEYDLYCFNDLQSLMTSELLQWKYKIKHFISRTIFLNDGTFGAYYFQSRKEKAALKKLKERFPQPDRSVTIFFREIELKGISFDLGKFTSCTRILSRERIKIFSDNDKVDGDKRPECFLVEAILDGDMESNYPGNVRLFLQIIDHTEGAVYNHHELTPELLRLTQHAKIKKYLDTQLFY